LFLSEKSIISAFFAFINCLRGKKPLMTEKRTTNPPFLGFKTLTGRFSSLLKALLKANLLIQFLNFKTVVLFLGVEITGIFNLTLSQNLCFKICFSTLIYAPILFLFLVK
jgi:hypothetical protein